LDRKIVTEKCGGKGKAESAEKSGESFTWSEENHI